MWGVSFDREGSGALVSLAEVNAITAVHKAVTWVAQHRPELLAVGGKPYSGPLRIEVRRFGGYDE